MKIESLLIAVVIVGLIATGFGLYITDVATNYDIPVSDQLTSVYGNTTFTNTLLESGEQDLKNAAISGSSNTFDVVELMKSGFTLVKTVFTTGIPSVFGLIGSIGQSTYIPPFIVNGLKAILLIAFMFSVVYLFLRYKNE